MQRFTIQSKKSQGRMIALVLPEPLQSEVRAAAKATGVPIVEIIRQCVDFAWSHMHRDGRMRGQGEDVEQEG